MEGMIEKEVVEIKVLKWGAGETASMIHERYLTQSYSGEKYYYEY